MMQGNNLVARILEQPAVLARFSAGRGVLASLLSRNERTTENPEVSPQFLEALEDAANVGRRFTERVEASQDSQPQANAASICRWELLVLRERLLELDVPSSLHGDRDRAARHLDAAANAARALSNGHRLHSLDRICDGGRVLDEQFDAIAQLRGRLAG
ncbi:MAG: hypothetical protein HW416_968 [Chloroflexi bacterium]|nr:hypothetical protein [Chloroflexota bacterium]